MPSDESGIDWRRLATDRNVSHGVARALWERARAAAQGDPARAEHAFHLMLDEAEAANATHEPGRETLADAASGARDASSLGPGKWTRVLLEDPKPAGPAGSARRATENAGQAPAERATEDGKQPSAETLRDKLVAAGQASKHAAALLAASDPATIVEALRELREQEGPGLLQKLMSVAGGAIERILDKRVPDPQTQTASGSPRVAPEPAGTTGLGATDSEQATPAKAGDPAAPAASTPDPATATGAPAANPTATATGAPAVSALDPATATGAPAAKTSGPATAKRGPAAKTSGSATANRTPTANAPDPAAANRTPAAKPAGPATSGRTPAAKPPGPRRR